MYLSLLILLASYPVHDATSTSIMWQGCQTFGFLIVLAMDKLRDADGTPKDNMYRALILQAALAGLMMVLSFGYRGRMLRTEAIERLRQEENDEKMISSTDDEEKHCTCRHNNNDNQNEADQVSIRLD